MNLALACAGWLVGCGGDESPPFVPAFSRPPADAPLAAIVDPLIGTAGDGQIFPGATVPWGMASPSPHTTITDPSTFLRGLVANAGYLAEAPTIHGFGQTHLSGVGCPDLGAPVIVPTVGAIVPEWEGYGSSYREEQAHAGYYGVWLEPGPILAEVTATARAGIHRLWFGERSGDANVLVDVGQSVSWRRAAGRVRVVSATEVEGSVGTGAFCAKGNRSTLYFVLRASQPAVEVGTWVGHAVGSATEAEGKAGAFLRFTSSPTVPVELVVGLSYVSIENARENLTAETAGRSFGEIHDAATRQWQQALERIAVEGGSEADRVRFYTALYHCLLQPNVVSDVNGEYPMADGAVGVGEGDRYSVFSLWDTYRTLHPLLTLVYPARQAGMLRTLASLAFELERPPRWELLGHEVSPMPGDPLPVVLADSLLKGVGELDLPPLYERLRAAAVDPEQRPGVGAYLELGYVPMELAGSVWGPATTTLEYALSDGALARLAALAGRQEDVSPLAMRAQSYAALFDPSLGLLRPRNEDGSWLEPFDPDALDGSAFQPRAGGPGYVEGTAWHYAFYVPHDLPGLAALHGDQAFVARLQSVFDTDRFVLWNEPDLAMPYSFHVVAPAAWRGQRAARAAMARFFGTGRDGLPGNDDTGTLSAWFVWSAMGLYPVAPLDPRYAIGSPLFSRVTVTASDGSSVRAPFVIVAANHDPDRPIVTQAKLDGVALTEPFVAHDALVAGATLELEMAPSPP